MVRREVYTCAGRITLRWYARGAPESPNGNKSYVCTCELSSSKCFCNCWRSVAGCQGTAHAAAHRSSCEARHHALQSYFFKHHYDQLEIRPKESEHSRCCREEQRPTASESLPAVADFGNQPTSSLTKQMIIQAESASSRQILVGKKKI